jgi:diguanylate cyclase (GGDEF)-like protein/PAS domain S-box-containing protein
MSSFNNKQPNISLILLVMVFAIIFVSIFTYLPIYANTLEQKTNQLKEEAEVQAILLKQIFTPVMQAKSQRTKQKKTEIVIKEIKSLWFQLNIDQPQKTFYLVYKNPTNSKVELILSSKAGNLLPESIRLIKPTMFLALGKQPGVQSITGYSKSTVLAAYAPVILEQWGIVVKYEEQSITPPILESAGYTLYAALLMVMVSWLIFRLSFNSLKSKAYSAEERYKQLLENSLDWVWEIDAKGNFTYSSKQASAVIGYEANAIIGKSFNLLFTSPDSKSSELIWKQKFMLKEAFTNLEIIYTNHSNKTTYLLLCGQPIITKRQKFLGYRGIVHDITELRKHEENVHDSTFFDSITGLPNRTRFIDQLRKNLQDLPSSSSNTTAALILLDLENIENINDQNASKTKDKILQVIAHRMQHHARKSDIVARLEDYQFVILVNELANTKTLDFQSMINNYLNRLLEMINEPMHINNEQIYVHASVGIAILPRDAKTVHAALKNAEVAMYEAKAIGTNHFHFFNENSQQDIGNRQAKITEIFSAIENNLLEMYYQLQVDTTNNNTIGLEALLRWHDPISKKVVCANEFIELIEDNEVMTAIDHWVVSRVVKDIAKLKQKQLEVPPVSINISSKKLGESSLPGMIEQTLKENPLPKNSLKIEITEDSILYNLPQSSSAIKQLTEMGIKVCLDDFGTGYSSLSYLQKMPIDCIKISHSFVKKIATSNSDLQVCRTIIQLAKSLETDVVAEGVQTEIQKDILQQEGCFIMQGYLYSQPQPLHKIESYLQRETSTSDLLNESK